MGSRPVRRESEARIKMLTLYSGTVQALIDEGEKKSGKKAVKQGDT